MQWRRREDEEEEEGQGDRELEQFRVPVSCAVGKPAGRGQTKWPPEPVEKKRNMAREEEEEEEVQVDRELEQYRKPVRDAVGKLAGRGQTKWPPELVERILEEVLRANPFSEGQQWWCDGKVYVTKGDKWDKLYDRVDLGHELGAAGVITTSALRNRIHGAVDCFSRVPRQTDPPLHVEVFCSEPWRRTIGLLKSVRLLRDDEDVLSAKRKQQPQQQDKSRGARRRRHAGGDPSTTPETGPNEAPELASEGVPYGGRDLGPAEPCELVECRQLRWQIAALEQRLKRNEEATQEAFEIFRQQARIDAEEREGMLQTVSSIARSLEVHARSLDVHSQALAKCMESLAALDRSHGSSGVVESGADAAVDAAAEAVAELTDVATAEIQIEGAP